MSKYVLLEMRQKTRYLVFLGIDTDALAAVKLKMSI